MYDQEYVGTTITWGMLGAVVVTVSPCILTDVKHFLALLSVMVLAIIFLMVKPGGGNAVAGEEFLLEEEDLASDSQSPDASKTAGEFNDPVRWSFLPSEGFRGANTSQPVESENEFAALKFLVLHRPTHDPKKEARGDYPYSWHFAGRKRLWEVRVQVRLKQKPDGPIFFGLEMCHVPGHKKSRAVQQTQRLVLAAIRAAIGKEFYQTPGEDPGDGLKEAEPPTFVMPMWALDQFHISEIGEEPDLAGDLNQVGMRRTEGMKNYIKAMGELVENFSTDKVYTFCFWGISQAIDVINWELRGVVPGIRMDANKLCGVSPLYVVAYILPPAADKEETRHLISRKKYFFKVALWSDRKPPVPEELNKILGIAGGSAPQPKEARRKGFSRVFAFFRKALICM